MNTKDIIISVGILILVLLGFLVLIKVGKSRSNQSSDSQSVESGAIPTTNVLEDSQGLDTSLAGELNPSDKTAQPDGSGPQGFESQRSQLDKKLTLPAFKLKEGVDYQAIIQTNLGDIKVDLFEKETPNTVNNFVHLANIAFYDGLIFHRVIPDFMIQGGDPLGTGTGGPGYSFDDEIVRDLRLVKGSLAMANSGKNTNGSQFFIVTKEATPWLDGDHTNFGQVVEGLDVADKISLVEKGPNDKPLKDVVIKTIVITEN